MRGRPVALAVNPHVIVRWDVAVTTPGSVFVQYNVYRRNHAETESWTRIAVISDQNTTTYKDYAATGRVEWEYAITQEETTGADTLESAMPDPVAGLLVFNWAYLHWPSAPADSYVPLYSIAITEDVIQQVDYHQAWGRRAGTAFIGDADYSRLSLDGLEDIQLGAIWPALRALLSLQPDEAATFCLRIGASAQRFFVNVDAGQRRGMQASYAPVVSMTEVHYEEAV